MGVKKKVITIHGVNHNPEWQAMVGKALEPHFRATAVGYQDYVNWYGPIKAIVNLWLGALSGVTFAAALLAFALSFNAVAGWLAFVAAVMLAAGMLAAHRGRKSCRSRVKVELAKANGTRDAAHVIAHSFGTYIVGHTLKAFPDMRFSRMVFVGSVLPKTHDWESILVRNEQAFESIHNEIGHRDWVVQLAGFLSGILRDMGDAGRVGFSRRVAHTARSPYGECDGCRTGTSRIHNVPFPEFEHSDAFRGINHAFRLWLPVLWGYSPGEFLRYLDSCKKIREFRTEQRTSDIEEATRELLEQKFTWTRRRTVQGFLEEYVRGLIGRMPGSDRITTSGRPIPTDHLLSIVWQSAELIAENATRAHEQYDLDESKRDFAVMKLLDPWTALRHAVSASIEMHQTWVHGGS